ncbi:LuxR family maltose regulon positive regulatory protein [Povalibacter uvarum]|uniref:LuxR family maltose regulon positive regulatory protein n=1 Tax=Povalibacter uvarum TaxID=732238 RepID=A0A841HJ09_9GAMM|nr:LuxR C-terminal-related transcriptional regulator [Povalibacter uvarum]MBB6092142.1 LuxR family maltose regulon positive regulatory protein [Povalibacter uvarum]
MRNQLRGQSAAAYAEPAHTPSSSRIGSDLGSPHLINSKLKPPLQTMLLVERASLIASLDTLSQRRLTLLCAPIGSGKTTLLSQWHAHRASTDAIAWLSLDEQDADPARLFSYLIGTVRSAAPAFDAWIVGRREELAEPALIDSATLSFIERLNQLDAPLTIVIDDFQCLKAPLLVRAFDLMLRRSPGYVRWVIAGRCMPELSLGSLRLEGQLGFLSAEDLKFDSPQIVELARGLCGRSLSMHEADCIRDRTEGWIAGAKLALLACEQPCADGLESFAGSHVEVARYLGESVLQEQSPAVREFLLVSSVVDRMTGELCDALLETCESQAMLEHLERAQLFIQPLDSHRHWYRYHTLFLDFLRGSARSDGAGRLAALHERASRWFAEHHLYEEALQHAFASRNDAWRGELLAHCTAQWLQSGEIPEVLRWSERLSRSEMLKEVAVCRSYIAALILCRRFDEAAATLRELQEVRGDQLDPSEAGSMRLLQTMYAVLSDTEGTLDVEDSGGLPASADAFLTGTLLTLQAYMRLRHNQFDAARRVAIRAREILRHAGNYGAGYADVVASLADRAQGDMRAATNRCEEMYAAVGSGRRNPAWMNAATALAYIRYEENRLAEAEALCVEVLPLLSVASTIENCTAAYVTLARTKAIAGQTEEARRLLDYLHSVLEGGTHHRFLAQVIGEEILLALRSGQLERARSVATEAGLIAMAGRQEWNQPRPYDEAWERYGAAYATWLIATGRQAEATTILRVLRDAARSVQYVYRETRLEALLACCLWQDGQPAAAFDALDRALSLTRGHGFTRGVFDETPALTQLVRMSIEQRRLRCVLPAHYLRKFDNVFVDKPASRAEISVRSPLPLEPLTDREVDILKLLAQGLSNQQISDHSRITLSTAKWHLKNVFTKLDVNTRTGALVRARELRLID